MLLVGLAMIGGCIAYLFLAFLFAVVQTMCGVSIWEDMPTQIGAYLWNTPGDISIY